MIDAKETYQLLPSQHVEAEATDRLSRHDAVFTEGGDGAVEGHSYEKLDHVEEHAYSVRRDSPPRWKRSPRSRVLAVVLSGLLFLCLLAAALSHPAPRETVRGAWHRMPFNKPTKQDLMALMPRVERNSSVSMKDYLAARFDPDDTTVMWTMATGAAPSYIPAARNWDLKRAELGMNDSVVVLCLDHACLDECERSGLRAHAAYLKDESVIPPPSQRSRLVKRSGAERGHVLAYLKFKAMLDMAKSGYYSLFFEGDTFLTADPFDHMLSRQNTTWDLQFTEDWGYLLNFGWVHLRPSNATISFFQLAYDKYIRHNQWDQELLSNLVPTLGTREIGRSRGVRGFAGDFDKEHWWLCDQIGLRLYMLPLHKFWATHIAAVEEYSLPDDVPEPVMNHLSAVTFANRQFYAKERGWAMDVDGFYTTPRPILRASTIWANYRAVAHYGRLVHVLAVKMGWALQVPKEITITGTERDGRRWIYVREWSRLISVQTAVTFNLDLLEANFFEHAERYAPNKTLTQWQNRRDVVDLSQFASLEEVITHLKSLNVAPAEGRVIELVGYDSANSTASKWPLLVRSTRGVPKHWREIRMCKHFHQQHFPYEWCTPLPLAWA